MVNISYPVGVSENKLNSLCQESFLDVTWDKVEINLQHVNRCWFKHYTSGPNTGGKKLPVY